MLQNVKKYVVQTYNYPGDCSDKYINYDECCNALLKVHELEKN